MKQIKEGIGKVINLLNLYCTCNLLFWFLFGRPDCSLPQSQATYAAQPIPNKGINNARARARARAGARAREIARAIARAKSKARVTARAALHLEFSFCGELKREPPEGKSEPSAFFVVDPGPGRSEGLVYLLYCWRDIGTVEKHVAEENRS